MGGWTVVSEAAPSGWTPVANQAVPPPAAPTGPITPKEGESFADTMKRAVDYGRTVTPEEMSSSFHEGVKKIPTVLGAALIAGPAILTAGAVGPEAASTAAGGGIAGSAAGGATGAGLQSVIEKTLHAASGENIFNAQTAKDIGESTAYGGAFGAGMGLLEKVAGSVVNSKLSRGMINSSVGATARDVTYGNPAKGILDNQITSPVTGDLEAYKDALRSGAPTDQALTAAGGRVAQVSQKINILAPQIDQALSQSAKQIPIVDVIHKPIDDAVDDIVANRSMTAAEKTGAVAQLRALQNSLSQGLGENITPLQANQIKQAIGNRINWAGNVAVTDEVKPAYRAVYGSLKGAVNEAVPEVADINENLSNLLSAQTDLRKLMQAEEAGLGKGALGSAVTGIARRFESVAGRAIPGVAALNSGAQQITPQIAGPLGVSFRNLMVKQQ